MSMLRRNYNKGHQQVQDMECSFVIGFSIISNQEKVFRVHITQSNNNCFLL